MVKARLGHLRRVLHLLRPELGLQWLHILGRPHHHLLGCWIEKRHPTNTAGLHNLRMHSVADHWSWEWVLLHGNHRGNLMHRHHWLLIVWVKGSYLRHRIARHRRLILHWLHWAVLHGKVRMIHDLWGTVHQGRPDQVWCLRPLYHCGGGVLAQVKVCRAVHL